MQNFFGMDNCYYGVMRMTHVYYLKWQHKEQARMLTEEFWEN